MKILSGFNTHFRCLISPQDRVHSKLLQVLPVFFSSMSHYAVLNVAKNASQDEIKKSFFEKSKQYHPDASPGNPHHHELFVKLNNAYSVLSNISKRKEYDRSLAPKPTYHYQSNENLYKYSEETFYYGANSSNVYYSTRNKPKNLIIALGVILFMCCGVAVRFLMVWNRHHVYKKQLDHNSMKASKLYQESRERSSKYGFREQLERLAEKQGKTIKSHGEKK